MADSDRFKVTSRSSPNEIGHGVILSDPYKVFTADANGNKDQEVLGDFHTRDQADTPSHGHIDQIKLRNYGNLWGVRLNGVGVWHARNKVFEHRETIRSPGDWEATDAGGVDPATKKLAPLPYQTSYYVTVDRGDKLKNQICGVVILEPPPPGRQGGVFTAEIVEDVNGNKIARPRKRIQDAWHSCGSGGPKDGDKLHLSGLNKKNGLSDWVAYEFDEDATYDSTLKRFYCHYRGQGDWEASDSGFGVDNEALANFDPNRRA
jgi:hypothetical protein